MVFLKKSFKCRHGYTFEDSKLKHLIRKPFSKKDSWTKNSE